MPKRYSLEKFHTLLPPILLFLIAGVCYLPFVKQLGFYNDDWYLIYGGTSQGSASFQQIFQIDRPFRGYFVGWMFDMFRTNILLYNLSAFLIRCVGAFGLLWILRKAWPQQRSVTYLAAVFFVVYPGFLNQPNAFDFQSHLWSLTLAIFSMLFTVLAIQAPGKGIKVLWIILAILTELVYLLLMEYFIGLEVFRFLLILYLTQKAGKGRLIEKAKRIIFYYLPFLILAIAFSYWRTVLFQNLRAGTDIQTMLGEIGSSPVLRGAWMLVWLLQDIANVIVLAWGDALYRLTASLRLKSFLMVLGWGAIAALLTWGVIQYFRRYSTQDSEHAAQPEEGSPWRISSGSEMVMIGMLSIIGALIPIHFSGRHIELDPGSRFTLPGSVGAALVLAGSWSLIGSRATKTALIAVLIGSAAIIHNANALRYAENWQTVRDFWWQVTWRIPQIKPGTVLSASYANQAVEEDYFVWGPANLIFYPQQAPQGKMKLSLTAITLQESDLIPVLMGSSSERDRRGFVSQMDFSQLLVFSLPTQFDCIHVLDKDHLELSDQDRPEIMLLASFSQLDRIKLEDTNQTPPVNIFGKEPAHTWCYYFQKASLARQRGDWEEAARLGKEALSQDLRPYDWIEWMPFAEAFAFTGQVDKLDELGKILRTNKFYGYQACRLVTKGQQQATQPLLERYPELVKALCGE